ncbi:polyprenyl synthetase family protein [Kitasatospora viridis]|uniref:Geranylgeranyl diphosphate synthase type I n=1 Tax=Kitasatospora viridis TaxID=281105 RepID=A0A561T6S8_9ACTN|nr:polyprenyl synthetase family protein [Kitasatospora viridis]TWF82814.1 geranylgeranyl diphosphate synthase type I [Kitasatospora viridis]
MTITAHTSHQPAPAPATLDRARELAEPLLRETVARLEPWMTRIAAYHLGWADADGNPGTFDSGKALRPALALLAAEAVGASVDAALPGAVAVELVHNFSLVHDDVMDGDRHRRGRPTVWREFGVTAAILVGDALQVLAFDLLLSRGGPAGPAAAARLAAALRELVDGQARDLRFATRPWTGPGAVTVAEYRAMAAGKTGALLAAAGAAGAVLGGAAEPATAALDAVGRELGLAFQCIDDVLGIWGDPAVTGKPVWGDLRERKRSLPVVVAASGSAAAARRLAELLAGGPETPDTRLRAAAELIEECGGRQACEREAAAALARAGAVLDAVPMVPAVRAQYAALADALLARVS